MSTPRIVPLAQLVPPPEPLRVAMDERAMDALVESIKQLGIIQALVVVPRYLNAKGEHQAAPIKGRHKGPMDFDELEIVDGHRRYMAAKRLELATVPVMVFEDAEAAKFQIMLDANVCREDVTAFEEGVQFLELGTKHEWSMDQLRNHFGKSEDYINDRVEIVRKDAAVAAAVRDRAINIGQAKEVLKGETPIERAMLLEQAAVHGATIKALREMRHGIIREAAAAQGGLPMNTPGYAATEPILSPEVCPWCGRNDDVANLVILRVHQYELADLKAVLDKFSRRALLEQLQRSHGPDT